MTRTMALALALCTSVAYAAPPAFEKAPEVTLVDANPRSATFGLDVGAEDFKGRYTLWYFRDRTCRLCDKELSTVHGLWQELVDDGLEASFVAVISNTEGVAVAAPRAKSVTWLLDVEGSARDSWKTQARHLVVVDALGGVRGRIDLSLLDLKSTASVDQLEEWIEDAAFGVQVPADMMVTSVEQP